MFGNVSKEQLDDLGLKNDILEWNCYEVSNIPGKIYKLSVICFLIVLFI